MGKIIFFDIDGTLVGYDGKMPDSTKEALHKAKENGHKIALCTGRSKNQIHSWLMDVGFDGIVGAAGAYVECDGEVIFHQCMEPKTVKKAVDYFNRHDIVYGFQSQSGVLVYEEQAPRFRQVFVDMGVEIGKIDQLLDGQQIVYGDEFFSKVEKLAYYNSPIEVKGVLDALRPEMDVTASSFEEPDESSGEVSTAGVNKALGMQKMIAYYGLEQKDTIAFGDGPNDVEMMQYAKIGVAMGNAVEFLKSHAYMVTDDVSADGIWHAMQKLGII